MGIGLTLVRSLVEMHDGSVEARSDGLGRRSEFVVRLPAVEQVDPISPPNHPDIPKEFVRRILVVDDNVDAAEILAMLLEMDGHIAAVAHDGIAAIAMAAECAPDVVMLDIGMPGMDGFEVARCLRQQSATANTTLVALTGYGQEEHRRQTLEAGFDHHLLKPLEMEELRRVLRECRVQ